MVNTIPPLGDDELIEIERMEFDELLGFALANIATDIEVLFLKKNPEKLEEFLRDKKAKNLQEYLKVEDEDFNHLKGLDMLTLPLLPNQLIDYSDDKLNSLLMLMFGSLFAECDEMAEKSIEFQNLLGIIKTRIIALVYNVDGQNCDIYETVTDYVKASVIEIYAENSLQIPKRLRIQLLAEERTKADDLSKVDENEVDEIYEGIYKNVLAAFDDHDGESFSSSDKEVIDKTSQKMKNVMVAALNSDDLILSDAMKKLEEDPSIDRIVNEILGVQ